MKPSHKELIERYFDGGLDPAELSELKMLLLQNPSVSEEFLAFGELEGALQEWGTAQTEESRDTLIAEIRQVSARRRVRKKAVVWLAAAAAIVLGLWTTLHGPSLWKDHPTTIATTSDSPLGKTRAVASFRGGALTSADGSKVGESLEPGDYHLATGTGAVETVEGTLVSCMAPASFNLSNTQQIALTEGVFMIRHPAMPGTYNIIAGGVSFSLEEGECIIRVLRSTCEVLLESGRLRHDATSLPVEIGRATLLQAGSPTKELPDAGPLRELGASLRKASFAHSSSGGILPALFKDPALVICYDFEPDPNDASHLINHAPRGSHQRDGIVIGASAVPDRRRPGNVMEFSHHTDRIRLRADIESTELTLAAWVLVNGLDRRYNSLFMCDDFLPGNIHWQMESTGYLALGSRVDLYQDIKSPPIVGPVNYGEWHHLATTCNAATGEVIHYLDGRPIHKGRLDGIPTFNITTAEIGNWRPAKLDGVEPEVIRNFMGKMDDFCLFTRVLSHQEVASLAQEK